MSKLTGASLEKLGRIITGRQRSLFLPDIEAHRDSIRARIAGKRILVIGGAGSIGSSTIHAMLPFGPKSLHVIDTNENQLAELVRDLRSRPDLPRLEDFATWAFDYGSPILKAFLHRMGRYDLVLNFAAVKHVRAERDPFSLWHLLRTNVLKQHQLQESLRAVALPELIFSVSTDKAANPTSAMGASKRLMEQVLFSDPAFNSRTARFANVAFSNGSLLQGFLERIAKGQALAAPQDTRRYFVSLEESGHICLLAFSLLNSGQCAIPNLNPESELIPLQEVVERTLEHFGLQPEYVNSEAEAKAWFGKNHGSGKWPLLLTPLDTSGEKPYEEFLAHGEKLGPISLKTIQAIQHEYKNPNSLQDFLAWIGQDRVPDESEIFTKMQEVVPTFAHRQTSKNLDQRM